MSTLCSQSKRQCISEHQRALELFAPAAQRRNHNHNAALLSIDDVAGKHLKHYDMNICWTTPDWIVECKTEYTRSRNIYGLELITNIPGSWNGAKVLPSGTYAHDGILSYLQSNLNGGQDGGSYGVLLAINNPNHYISHISMAHQKHSIFHTVTLKQWVKKNLATLDMYTCNNDENGRQWYNVGVLIPIDQVEKIDGLISYQEWRVSE